MDCKWGHNDCCNIGDKCHLCSSNSFHYKQEKKKKIYSLAHRQAKITKRQGARTEYDNHKMNEQVLNGITARMTPNSGAGQIKGDEEIVGLINTMEEIKTSDAKNARGEKQFTIKREWLEKLNREANAANKEFFYLKFRFGELDSKFYTIIETDLLMSMIKTMYEDRKKANLCSADINIANKRRELVEAENTKLRAEINLLKSIIEKEKIEKGGLNNEI